MLTNIFMMKSCLSRGENIEIFDEFNGIKMVDTKLEIKGEKGGIVSLVPLRDCLGVMTEGLKYPLENAELKLGEGLGVSNVMTGGEAAVSVREGELLVIEARD
jgi:thiamine pyrophosphokinase